MQEDHRNGHDDSEIVETSEPFTITRAVLNGHISSVDHQAHNQGSFAPLENFSHPWENVLDIV